MVRIHNLSKSFDGHTALVDLTLEISEGQTTVVIGPSGCGKSTLLRVVIGLVRADSGSVSVFGEELRPDNLIEIRRRIGYVIQDGGLFPHLTGRENVSLMAGHLGWSSEKLHARVDELSELVRLERDRLELYPVELSGGQQQRVGLMRALFLDPDLLLMDEPLGALDPMIRAGLQEELRQIFQRLGKTVVLVTHDLAEAAYLGDSIVLMREGRVVQKGGIDDLNDNPRDPFVTEFVGAHRSLSLGTGGGR